MSKKKNIGQHTWVRSLLITCFDIFFLMAAMAAIIWRNQLSSDILPLGFLLKHSFLLCACMAVALLFFKTGKNLWSYAESREHLLIIASTAVSYAVYLPLSKLLFSEMMPISLSSLAVASAALCMLTARFAYRRIRELQRSKPTVGTRLPLLIVGAGDAAVMLLEEMLRNNASRYLPVCLVDDDPSKIGRRVRNVPVEGPITELPQLVKKYHVRDILVALPSAGRERNCEILDLCVSVNCRVRLVPDMLEIIQCNSPETIAKSVREVRIEDLLGRDPISFENEEIYQFLSDKIVMVTGGGGSIGSELCRQIAKHSPKQLVIVDIYENNAYDIQQELLLNHPQLNLKVEIASVRDAHKINILFDRYHPQIIFHAAAHKHVPLMENCPEEAIRNNVYGTYNVATAAGKYGAEKFILVSTDKAVNPTNVMGASKRLCEMVVQSMAGMTQTRYACVRFGNVLGSNGSVIPLFKRQIQHGGPVTITDKRIIRYFMTIPEASQLVLQAGAMASESEIFVLDMGEPVRILELAEHLIRLSGYTPYVDMPIIETGLRPGEKLYEELLMRSENLETTPNHKIFIERQRGPFTPAMLRDKLDRLDAALATDSVEEIVKAMHEVVPTYKTPEEVNNAKMADLDYKDVAENENNSSEQ